jgi:hypothetical protein
MTIKDINCIYLYIDILNNTTYKKISNFLWLIVFFEYSQPNSKTLNLENKKNKKTNYVINLSLSKKEKNIFSKIPILTEKSQILLSF